MANIKEYTTKYRKKKVVPLQVCEYEVPDQFVLDSSGNVAYLMKHIIGLNQNTVEHMYLIVCNANMKIKGLYMLTKGTLNGTIISPRDIILNTLLLNCNNFFLVHNHPSGMPRPSKADQDVTKRIKDACAICDYNMMDHLILGEDTYYSFTGDSTKTIPDEFMV